MKQLNEKKYKRQLIGKDRWFNSLSLGLSHKDRSGCLNYMTGVGKTFTAIIILKEYFNKYPNSVVTILCPSNLIKQWENNLKSNFNYETRKFINIYSPDYLLTNEIILNPRLLIVDELDAFYSEQRVKLIDKTYIRYVDILGLTATYEDLNDRHLYVRDFCPIVDKIAEKEALNEGYISEYIEYNLGIEFSPEEQEEHKKLSELIRKGLSKFDNQLDLCYKCIQGGKHKGQSYTSTQFCTGWAQHKGWTANAPQEVQDLWHPRTVFSYAVHLSKTIRKRKELIYNNGSKLSTTVQIMNKFVNTKSVIFSQSTEFANTLYGIVNQMHPDNSVIFHSKVETQYFPSPKTGKNIKHGKVRLKKRAIDRITKGLSNHLITGSSLDKGLDIPELKLGVTTSGTQNPTQYKQRKGRTARVDKKDEQSVSIVVNIYMKNSKELDWLKKRQDKGSNIIYWIDSVDDISYKPKKITKGIDINDI